MRDMLGTEDAWRSCVFGTVASVGLLDVVHLADMVLSQM